MTVIKSLEVPPRSSVAVNWKTSTSTEPISTSGDVNVAVAVVAPLKLTKVPLTWAQAYPVTDPSVMFYVDVVEVRRLSESPPLPTVRPDFDQDGDVDQADFGHIQACFSGPGLEQTEPACFDALLDEDQDVDADDFQIFQDCISGPNNPVDLACEN